MHRSRWPLIVMVLLLAPTARATATRRPEPPFNACKLISAAAINAVEGAKLVAAKPTSAERDGLIVSACYFQVRPAAQSLSLEVVRASKVAKHDAVRARWNGYFHARREVDDDEETREIKAGGRPLGVSGLGREAWWVGRGPVGALYVLTDDAYLRLSVGGAGDRGVKIERAKRLLASALAHLPR